MSSNSTTSTTSSSSQVFPFHVRLALVFIVEASSLSALSVLSLLLYIGWNAFKSRSSRSSYSPFDRKKSIQRHIRIYFISMLVSDLVQATGGLVSIKWITEANVTDGAACTAQSILEEIGDVGVALATLAIAIQTFCIIVLHREPQPSVKVPVLVVSAIWIFIALIIGVSAATHIGKGYWGDTGYWCWITSAYPKQRILLEYLWMWLACLLNIVLYIPIALTLRGNLHVQGLKVHFGKKDSTRILMQSRKEIDSIAMKMLFYPLIYTLTVLPIAIARWLAFQNHSVTFAATIFSDILFCCSGIFNVVLFTLTRPALLSLPEPEHIQVRGLPKMSSSSQNTVQRRHAGTVSSTTSSNLKDKADDLELNVFNPKVNDRDLFKLEGYQFQPFATALPLDGSRPV